MNINDRRQISKLLRNGIRYAVVDANDDIISTHKTVYPAIAKHKEEQTVYDLRELHKANRISADDITAEGFELFD